MPPKAVARMLIDDWSAKCDIGTQVASVRSGSTALLVRTVSMGREDKMTRKAEQSLRYAVEKWLGFRPPKSARVTAYGRSVSGEGRYVCVETVHDDEHLALFLAWGRLLESVPSASDNACNDRRAVGRLISLLRIGVPMNCLH